MVASTDGMMDAVADGTGDTVFGGIVLTDGMLLTATLGTMVASTDSKLDAMIDGTGDTVLDGIILKDDNKLGSFDDSLESSLISSP